MSDRALRALSQYGETHVFLRGLVVQLGFKTATVKLMTACRGCMVKQNTRWQRW